jgi:hypothetical protein
MRFVVLGLFCFLAVPGWSRATVYISTTSNATVAGVPCTNGDIVALDPARVVVSHVDLFGAVNFNGGNGSNKNLDGFSKVPGGWVFSTSTDFVFGGVTYLKGDLVLWDGVGMSQWLSASVFSAAGVNIDAFDILGDGRVLLSTGSAAALAGLSFGSGDVVLYDPALNTASVYSRWSDWSTGAGNIDAVALLPDGSMLFSTVDNAHVVGLSFLDGDLIRWDGVHFSVWLYESALFGGANDDIDGLAVVADPAAVPEPGSPWLLLAGVSAWLRGKWS